MNLEKPKRPIFWNGESIYLTDSPQQELLKKCTTYIEGIFIRIGLTIQKPLGKIVKRKVGKSGEN